MTPSPMSDSGILLVCYLTRQILPEPVKKPFVSIVEVRCFLVVDWLFYTRFLHHTIVLFMSGMSAIRWLFFNVSVMNLWCVDIDTDVFFLFTLIPNDEYANFRMISTYVLSTYDYNVFDITHGPRLWIITLFQLSVNCFLFRKELPTSLHSRINIICLCGNIILVVVTYTFWLVIDKDKI